MKKKGQEETAVQVGRKYEDLAAEYLKKQGYRILERNYRCRKGEIDLIGIQEGYLCFVEVKYRSSGEFGGSLGAVDLKKQRRICGAALYYLMEKGYGSDTACRFDVAGISRQGVELITNAFEFRR